MECRSKVWIMFVSVILTSRYAHQKELTYPNKTGILPTGDVPWVKDSMKHDLCDLFSFTKHNKQYIKADCSNRNLTSVPQDLPIHIRDLYLRGNAITSLESAFVRYPELVHLDISRNWVNQLDVTSFMNLTKLEKLDLRDLSQGKPLHIHESTFFGTPSLKYLNVACVREEFKDITKALSTSHLQLDTLIMDYLGIPQVDLVLDKQAFEGMDTSLLRRLSMRHNQIAVIKADFLMDLVSLEYIALANDRPFLLPVNYTQFREFIVESRLVSLEVSNVLRNKRDRPRCLSPSTDDYFVLPRTSLLNTSRPVDGLSQNISNVAIKEDRHIYSDIPRKVKLIHVPGSISLYFSADVKTIYLNPDNSVQYLNMSFCDINSFTGPVYGLTHLEILDISECCIQYVGPDALGQFRSLRFLYMQNNELGRATLYGFYGIFNNLSNLELLDISGNSIIFLHTEAFSGLKNLKYLYLMHNKLALINIDILSLRSLQHLDLSQNSLGALSKNFTEQIEYLARVTLYSIDLSNNKFVCDCERIDFMRWLDGRNSTQRNETDTVRLIDEQKYQCSFPNNSVTLVSKVDVEILAKSCTPLPIRLLTQTLVPSSVAALLFTIAIVSYLCRWRLRYWFFKVKMLSTTKRQPAPQSRRYSAFVAHAINSDLALSWTVNKLLPRVERDWEMRLFIWERDSIPGWSVADNIISAVDNSDLTLILVEPAFCLPNDWGEFMLQMALIQKRYKLIYLHEVEVGRMSPVLYKLMVSGYLEWPSSGTSTSFARGTNQVMYHLGHSQSEDDDGTIEQLAAEEKLFWKQLKSYIKKAQKVRPVRSRNMDIQAEDI